MEKKPLIVASPERTHSFVSVPMAKLSAISSTIGEGWSGGHVTGRVRRDGKTATPIPPKMVQREPAAASRVTEVNSRYKTALDASTLG